MNPLAVGLGSGARAVWRYFRASAGNVYDHRGLALFSLVAAFAIWVTVQDVENPRKEGTLPIAIPIQDVLNRPDGYIVDKLSPVRVRVEAREADLPNLHAGDFKATVDVKGVNPLETESRQVQVESQRRDVKVLSVDPQTVEIRMIRAVEKEFRVQVHQTGDLPTGFRLAEEPETDPAFVTVRGRPELVDSVKTVEMDVNLSGVRSETFEHEGALVARTGGGNPVTVDLSQQRSKATFKIVQVFTQRTVPVLPPVVGAPATGYRVTAVSWDPPVVTATGTKPVVDGLPATVATDRVDITGARTDVVQTKRIDAPPNVTLDRQSVVVRVKIEAMECGGTSVAPCPSMTFIVGPNFDPPPPGLTVQNPGGYWVQVRLSGPFLQLRDLKAGDIKATVSLTSGGAGTANYPVVVSPPSGLRVDSADATVAVTLVAVTP